MSDPSSNPTYKLYYFNIRAVAEPIRYLFAYGGISFEDVRVERADWPNLKSTMPMEQIPVLEVDGQRVHQSLAIERYLAKRVGLTGDNDWENLQIDSVVDTVNDLRIKMYPWYFETDVDAKQKKKEALLNETVPFYFRKLDELALVNNGHLAVSKLTWADLFFAALLELFNTWIGTDVSKYPNLREVTDNVYNLEAIKDWMKRRPVTEM